MLQNIAHIHSIFWHFIPMEITMIIRTNNCGYSYQILNYSISIFRLIDNGGDIDIRTIQLPSIITRELFVLASFPTRFENEMRSVRK